MPDADSLADHLALELREHPEHLEHGAPARRRSVEGLRVDVGVIPKFVSPAATSWEVIV
jgi:hypothetical protein